VLQCYRDKQRRPEKSEQYTGLNGPENVCEVAFSSTSQCCLTQLFIFYLKGLWKVCGAQGAAGRQGGGLRVSLKVSKVSDLKIDTLDPFPCHAGPRVWSEFPWGQCSGFEAESSTLSSHEVYNSIFIAFLSNKVYGTSGTHSVKNADSLYEFLMGEEEQNRPQGELVKR